jgi:flagellar hook-length control protein FliK
VAEQVAAAAASRAQLVQRGGSTQFYVRLDPPDLGTVHVHLQASEGNVSARLVVSSEQARSALEAQLPDLRSRLGSAGVQLGGLDVSHQQAGGHGAHSPSGEGVSAATPAAVSDPGPVYGPAGEGAVNVIA